VRNRDYVIYIVTKGGRSRAWAHRKVGEVWLRTGPDGQSYRMTAEQLLSHLLPVLAGDQPAAQIVVERRNLNE
jgi:hypothetical protein